VTNTTGSSRQATGDFARERLANIPPEEATTNVITQEATGCFCANLAPPRNIKTTGQFHMTLLLISALALFSS